MTCVDISYNDDVSQPLDCSAHLNYDLISVCTVHIFNNSVRWLSDIKYIPWENLTVSDFFKNCSIF